MKKIITLGQVQNLIKQLKQEAKTIVLAGGCFDILHQGHLRFLEAAKKHGDILIIALESDENVKRLKGQERPINKESLRAKNLIRTGFVDYVIILPTLKTATNYLNLVKTLIPDIIAVTAGDSQIANKKRQAETVGGKVKVVINRLPSFSTSKIIKKS